MIQLESHYTTTLPSDDNHYKDYKNTTRPKMLKMQQGI